MVKPAFALNGRHNPCPLGGSQGGASAGHSDGRGASGPKTMQNGKHQHRATRRPQGGGPARCGGASCAARHARRGFRFVGVGRDFDLPCAQWWAGLQSRIPLFMPVPGGIDPRAIPHSAILDLHQGLIASFADETPSHAMHSAAQNMNTRTKTEQTQ